MVLWQRYTKSNWSDIQHLCQLDFAIMLVVETRKLQSVTLSLGRSLILTKKVLSKLLYEDTTGCRKVTFLATYPISLKIGIKILFPPNILE